MKKSLLFFTILIFLNTISFAQNRAVARGAEPGELYLTTFWYGIYGGWGPPSYDTLRLAVYRISEHGQKVTIQYDVDYFADQHTPPGSVMQLQYILADATSGVLYAKRIYMKSDYYDYTQFWVSFDYGKNWIFREENMGNVGYFATGLHDSVICKGGENRTVLQSRDFGESFFYYFEVPIPYALGDCSYNECEFLGIGSLYNKELHYTSDCANSFTIIPIDSQFMFGNMSGKFPDVYRGGKEGEVYIHSWFPEYPGQSYKASFSADTGHTFRHVYVNENYQWQNGNFGDNQLLFMSDREPGVFYILHLNQVDDTNPYGWHLELCIDYYRDYGETLEATFCHDLTKDYEYEEVECEHVTYLDSKVINQNSVQLQWSSSAESSFIRGYHVYRNNVRITSELLTDTIYLDENLPVGEYEYYVRTYFKEGCVSDSSNHVAETIELGVKEFEDGITIYPNPTNGQLIINNEQLIINNVEIFDIYGKKYHPITLSSHHLINISHLQAGVYFVKIITGKGIVTRKVVKY